MQNVPPEPLLELSPFDAHYGLEVLACTPEEVRGRLTVIPEIKQPTGVVHGGVYAAIAEALASMGTNSAVVPDGGIGLGMHNSTSFLRPIAQGTVHATARPRHRGRTTWVWDVELSDDRAALCAVSRVTIAVRPAAG
jgi:1,4-dihydroxy-2-naphthoyl-CoA hydrolase